MQSIFRGLCFVAIISLFICCNKQNRTVQDDNAGQLVGNWELREVQAGMTPNTQYGVGNGNRLHFSETTYEQYTNDSLVSSGTYQVVQDTTVVQEVGLVVPAGQFTSRIIFDNNPFMAKPFFQFSTGQLILLSGFFPTDGGSRRVYQKMETGR